MGRILSGRSPPTPGSKHANGTDGEEPFDRPVSFTGTLASRRHARDADGPVIVSQAKRKAAPLRTPPEQRKPNSFELA